MDGAYRSTNGGQTWQPTLAQELVDTWLVDPVVPGLVYSGNGCGSTSTIGGSGGLQRSTNSGETWLRLQQPGCFIALRQNPGGSLFALTTDGSLIASNNGGEEWQSRGLDLAGRGLGLAVSPDEQTLFVATETGLYRSQTGGL